MTTSLFPDAAKIQSHYTLCRGEQVARPKTRAQTKPHQQFKHTNTVTLQIRAIAIVGAILLERSRMSGCPKRGQQSTALQTQRTTP
jgi:hypothetical protein